jgi:glucosamine-6-phosphate deaminase
MIKLRRFATAEEVTRAAADAVCGLVRAKPDAAIGLATGRTQEPLLAELLRRYHAKDISFKHARFFHLDEYWGMPKTSPDSMSGSLNRMFVGAIDTPQSQFHRVDGLAADPVAEAARYESVIRRAGGIDLQILGIGTNAHIAFNEPGSPHDSRMRLITLTDETREANRALFPAGAPVPSQALTIGIATILDCKSILMLVTGRSKGPAMRAALEGPVGAACPASALRRHPDCLFLCDTDATQGLSQNRESYA